MAAADPAAQHAGVLPGLPLANARALVPDLRSVKADPAKDRQTLAALAGWCIRYTPWTAVDNSGGGNGGGIWLDISGCAHLFDGEGGLLEDLLGRLEGFDLHAFAAVADTPGAAWAMVRFGRQTTASTCIVPSGETRQALAPLPVAALRLPVAVAEGLARVGLRCIGDLLELPRAPLALRFGEMVMLRLDQALGRKGESITPRPPLTPMRARLAFAEPIQRAEDITLAVRQLLEDLCGQLERAHQGARRLDLSLYRVDGTRVGADVGASRPVRNPDHLERLFKEKLTPLDAGFGVEVMVLTATTTDPLAPTQTTDAALDGGRDGDCGREGNGLACLIDRLGNRLGMANVMRLVPYASHIPERACRELSALAPAPKNGGPLPVRPRPVYLLPWPEPIEVMAPVPDHPPVMFRWRRVQHRVAGAEGPERIGPEWWLEELQETSGHQRTRDYYRVEDTDGRRFWVYREGTYRPGIKPRWYLHGIFP